MKKNQNQKNCERCGKAFSCGMKDSAPCWCVNLKPLKILPAEYKDCLCEECLKHFEIGAAEADFYVENGLTVFTEAYHLKRGYCCKSGCRHCPYT